ncbi:MAG: sulfotransferase [Flavobacteriales bacterium]|nr:sulfotransferase [Flavobacteriales bacterium]|tara:strand:- start:1286 stop:2194 length:909 start_codon:yes stop_codon:yes gene_type:complete
MKRKLPNFLIVGAAKSGTSSLHNYLNQHQDVFMPSYNTKGIKVKEPRFFIKDLVEHRLHYGVWNWEEYISLFDSVKDEKAIGESTVLYLYYYNHSIKNIKKYLGEDIKIIIMLRNPVDRAYSAFHHVSRGFKEQYTFEKALEIEDNRLDLDPHLTPMVMYKDMGMYSRMVRAFKNSFKNVHIILYEDFRDNTEQEMIKTFDFLELNKDENIDFITRHNVGGKRWKNKYIKYIFMKTNWFKSLLKILIPKKIRYSFRKKMVNISTKEVVEMNVNTRQKLKNDFKEDVQKLSKIINRDVTHWTK